MKFLCDRCKTRYSIGDDRVRGKILKIRCKNCANVITVREGMPSPDAAEAEPGPQGLPRRVQRTTIAAPAVQSEAPAPPDELDAPAGSAKPPPALEEEWYVSIDGEQAGPFSLADAQRWVAGHPADADLHCWNEGFDDWLPVDKVRHFRGLRKRPVTAPVPVVAPVPAPRVPAPSRTPAPAAAVRPAPRAPSEDEPKPLFAATMAQLEKGSAPPVAASAGLGAAVSPVPSPLRPLGAPAAARPLDLRGTGGGRPAATPSNGFPPMPAHTNGAALQAKATPVHAPVPPAFDASELGDSATQLEAPAFDPGPEAAAPPGLAGALAALDDDDDLDIGEVSRVVKLADLAKGAAAHPQPAAVRPGPGPLNRAGPEGAVAKDRARLQFNRTGPIPRPGEPAPGLLADAMPSMPLPAGPIGEPLPAAAVSHRRGMIALIAGAIVLVGVAVAVVVFFVRAGDEVEGGGLGRVDEIDTTRPDVVRPAGSGDPVTANPPDPPPNPFSPPKPRRPVNPPPVNPPPVNPPPDLSGGGNKLEAREIEEMAGKNSSVTQRCYMRAQRGAEGILLGDVKKIAVTLTISGDGAVTDAQLSDNQAANSLGKCLLTSIRTWKFRASPGGTFRFVLHFG